MKRVVFSSVFEADFAEITAQLAAEASPEISMRWEKAIIRLAEKYGEVRLDAACQRALAFGNPHYRTVKTILEKGLEPQATEPTPPAIASVGAYLHGPEALLGRIEPVQQEIPA